MDKGIFARHGIKLELEFTENSKSQREGLAAGKFEVVHSAVDNALAMIEVAKIDVVIVSGGDGGTNEFIVGKGIDSFDGVRGKTLVIDAPNTAYALQGIKILLQHGLKVGVDYKLNPVGNGTHRLEGDDGGRRQRRRDHEPAVLGAGHRGRHEEPRPHQRHCSARIRPAAPSCCAPGPRRMPRRCERYLAGYIEVAALGGGQERTATRRSRC